MVACLQTMHSDSLEPLVVLVLEEVMAEDDVLEVHRVLGSTFEEVRHRPTGFASGTVAVAANLAGKALLQEERFHFQKGSSLTSWNLACCLVVLEIDWATLEGAVLGIRRRPSCFRPLDLHSAALKEETVGTFLVAHSARGPDCHTAAAADPATCYYSQTVVASETVAVHRAVHCKALAETVADHMAHPVDNFHSEADRHFLNSFAAC